MTARPTKETELRSGCCAEWPKPCGYHEGYLDGFEHGFEIGKADRADLDAWVGSVPASGTKPDREIDDIIRHSLGLGDADEPYRRHYCSPPTPALTEAVERGLMTGPHERDDMVSPMWFVTKAGASSVGATLPT